MNLGENEFVVNSKEQNGKFLILKIQDSEGKNQRLSIDTTAGNIIKNKGELKEGAVVSLTKLGEIISSVVVVRG